MAEEERLKGQPRSVGERVAVGGITALSIPFTYLINQTEAMHSVIVNAPSFFQGVEYPAVALGFFILGMAVTADNLPKRRGNTQELHRTGPLR